MSTRPFTDPPEWIIMGVSMPEGSEHKVMVVASTKLSQAEIKEQAMWVTNIDEDPPYAVPQFGHRWWDLSARLKNFTMVFGDSYPEALAKLFGEWSPEVSERPALPSSPKELT